jgi:ADP-ribosylglycohydrolase
VIAAVHSLGGDALACAAAGALVGGRFGKDALPQKALSRIPQGGRVAEMAQRFAKMAI